MIAVTLGTQRFQMNRLVEAVDRLAVAGKYDFFIQLGNSTYEPRNCRHQNFLNTDEYEKLIDECSILITHAGVGTIMKGISAEKPVIVVPRLVQYQEHVDDHQVQIAEAFAGKQCVLYCDTTDKLPQLLIEAETYRFQPYTAPESRIEDIILDFIHKINNREKDA